MSLLALRGGVWPKALALLGIVGAIVYSLVVVAQVVRTPSLIVVLAGVGGVVLLPVWYTCLGLSCATSGNGASMRTFIIELSIASAGASRAQRETTASCRQRRVAGAVGPPGSGSRVPGYWREGPVLFRMGRAPHTREQKDWVS